MSRENCELRYFGEISTLKDQKLRKIDVNLTGFFDVILSYKGKNQNDAIADFIGKIWQIKRDAHEPFWTPIMDPSSKDGMIIFEKGLEPFVCYPFALWENNLAEEPSVDGKKWSIGSGFHAYARAVDIINQLVSMGWAPAKSIEAVVINSADLGNWKDSPKSSSKIELTGSRQVGNYYDLGNTFKFIKNSDGTWGLTGGSFVNSGANAPIASIIRTNPTWYNCDMYFAVPLLILE